MRSNEIRDFYWRSEKHLNKMKKLFILFICGMALCSSAQDKLLTIQDALWKARTVFAPTELKNASFIPSSASYAYVKDNGLVIVNGEAEKQLEGLSLTKLNKAVKAVGEDTLAEFPVITWQDVDHFHFAGRKAGEWSYSLKEDKLGRYEMYYTTAAGRDETP